MKMKSIIYRNSLIYKIIMKLLFGKEYTKRYTLIAEEAENDNVLDLCCGDCELAKYIKNYKGADFNPIFVKSAKRKGLDVIELDVLNDRIPHSECIVIQASLYHFIPEHKKLIEKMLTKAEKVIISESIVNLTQSKMRLVAWIAKVLTKTSREHTERFTKEQLIKLYIEFGAKKIIYTPIELIGVFKTKLKTKSNIIPPPKGRSF